MDLEAHWRLMRTTRAKRQTIKTSREQEGAFRKTIFEQLCAAGLHPHWRERPNADFAKTLNGLALMTYEGRAWDTSSARTFRLALEKDITNDANEEMLETDREERRVRGIKDLALSAILRSQAPDQSYDELENDVTRLGLELAEDRNASIAGLSKAFDLLSIKLAKREL